MKKRQTKAVPAVPVPIPKLTGAELFGRLALEALNTCGRDRQAALRLFAQWLGENKDLRAAAAEYAIRIAAGQAIGRDIRAERVDVLRGVRALPVVENGVAVDAALMLPPRNACIPQPSAAAQARHAARVNQYLGLFAFPLPVTGKPIGSAKAWEIKEACLWYGKQRRGFGKMEHLMAFVWQALPDKDKKESQQKPASEHLDLETLKVLDRRAQIAEEGKTLGVGEEGAA